MSDAPAYYPEPLECIGALETATTHMRTAVARLASAPDADMAAKSTIDRQLGEIREMLETMTHRLDDMPTWKPGQGG